MELQIQPNRIVVADDDADDRLLIRDAFEESKLDHEVDFVDDGVEIIEYLQRSGKFGHLKNEPYPGLIILDLNMPRKDGMSALKEIKARPEWRDISVVILTTSNSDDDRARTLNHGAESFVTKPATFGGLVEMIRVISLFSMGMDGFFPAET